MRLLKLFFLLFSCSLTAQTVLLQEDFNACALPADWTVNLTGNPDAVWYIGDEIDNDNSNGNTIDGSCMLVFDDDATGDNTPDWNIQITTPAFDGTQFSTLNFSTDVHFRQYEESYLRISVFNGSEFIQLAEWSGNINTGEDFEEFVTFTADLSFYANDNMQIRYEFDDGQSWTWWAGIDNVSVIGEGDAENLVAADFNSCALPEGWLTNVFSGEDDWQFGIPSEGGGSGVSMNGSCFAYFDDDFIGEDAPFSSVSLISPVFNGTDYADIFLDFDVILRRFEDLEHLGIYVFDGTEAVNVVNYFTDLGGPAFDEYVHERIDLSPFRKETMRVVFLYDDADAWGWWVGLDNIKISGSGSLNDLCENYIDLAPNAACIPGSNQNAIFTGEQPSCDNRNEGALWYRYVPIGSGISEVVSNADFNDIITVFTGSCAAPVEYLCYDRDEQGFTGENLFFEVTAFTEYFIRVSGKRGDYGVPRGELCIELKAPATPPVPENNDACAAATPLTIDANCLAGNNLNADFDGDSPSLNVLSRADIWYTFTAGAEPVEVVSGADFADVITVFAGECGNLTEIAANDYGQKLRLEYLTAGENYLIQISGFFSTVEGNVCAQIVTVEEEIPANNDCFAAQTLTVGADCYAGNNHGATQSEPRPGCETEYEASVWFEFVAPASGAIKLNTGADFVHSVSVYGGTCGDLEEVYCTNNPLVCDGYFQVGSLAAGETYYLQIASASNHLGLLETGEFCLSLLDGETMTMPGLALNVGVECTGTGIGTLTVAATGGTGFYTFTGNSSGETLQTGDNYLVIVSDDAGCEVSVSGTANCGIPDCFLTTDLTHEDISCYGATDGTASVSAEGAGDTFTYLWSNDAQTADITDLAAGIYTVTVTDASGCSTVESTTIYEPAELLTELDATAETAYQANDGSVSANPTGGTAPFTYAWSNGSTAAAQNGLAGGIYTVTVTDSRGCQITESIEVTAFACAVSADIEAENSTCFNANDGALSVAFTSGSAPYTYLWSTGATSANIVNLSPGSYTVTATDANDCPLVLSAEITQPTALQANATATGETALNAADGSATAPATGGSAPYTYAWSNGGTGQDIDNLTPGNYTVTITDANDCATVQTVTVNAFNCALAANVSTENALCFGENNGTATAEINGGTAPFTYAWSSGGTEMTEENLGAGNYTLTVTDGADCPAVISFTVFAPAELTTQIAEQNNPICADENTGSATVNAQGGTGDYGFVWSSGGTAATEDNLSPGVYFVTVSDENNCTTVREIEIIAADNINPVASTQDVILSLDADGNATLAAGQIDNGSSDNCGAVTLQITQTAFTCNELGENNVNLTVADASGNTSSATATVTIIDDIAPEIICPANLTADCDGYAEYALPTVTDNCVPNAPLLTAGLASGSIFPAGETTVTFSVSDASNNGAECSFIVTTDSELTVTAEVEKPTCNGDADGSATVSVAGGSGLTYAWNDPAAQTTATASNLTAGTYQVTVTDENGCATVQTVVIPEPAALAFSDIEIINDSNNNGNGSITLAVTGGEMPYSYVWTLADDFFADTPNLINLAPGDYILEVTDAAGCILVSDALTVDSETAIDAPTVARWFEVFPNPTAGRFFVQIGLPQAEEVDMVLYDVTGKQIRVFNLGTVREHLHAVDLTRLPAGVYELKAVVGKEVAVFRVVKI